MARLVLRLAFRRQFCSITWVDVFFAPIRDIELAR